MFLVYIPIVVLMVVFRLQDVKKNKKKTPPKKKHRSGRQKKDRQFRQARKASNKWANKDFIVSVGIFGLLPTSILGEKGDSLTRASDMC